MTMTITMAAPVVARTSPIAVSIEKGKTYYWCACGKSARQPFCDGSHQGTTFSPMKVEATESKTAYLCGCKRTGAAPFCDGSHQKL